MIIPLLETAGVMILALLIISVIVVFVYGVWNFDPTKDTEASFVQKMSLNSTVRFLTLPITIIASIWDILTVSIPNSWYLLMRPQIRKRLNRMRRYKKIRKEHDV